MPMALNSISSKRLWLAPSIHTSLGNPGCPKSMPPSTLVPQEPPCIQPFFFCQKLLLFPHSPLSNHLYILPNFTWTPYPSYHFNQHHHLTWTTTSLQKLHLSCPQGSLSSSIMKNQVQVLRLLICLSEHFTFSSWHITSCTLHIYYLMFYFSVARLSTVKAVVALSLATISPALSTVPGQGNK